MESEAEAIMIADRFKGDVSTEDKIKWLATEVVEVGMAYQAEDEEHLLEELGDCAFLISHILSRYSDKGIIHFITEAAEKMKERNRKKKV